jgi:hypothetical protein
LRARTWTIVGAAAFVLLDVPAARAGSKWLILRDPSNSYVVQYPATLKVITPKGEGCANGTCRSIEQVDLSGSDGSIALAIQRDINPKRLSIQAWYELQASRPLQSATESVVVVGDRNAIRRRGLVPAETVHMLNGKEVSRNSTLRADDSIFVPLNPTDVLTIVAHPKSQFASATFDHIIETVRFGPANR